LRGHHWSYADGPANHVVPVLIVSQLFVRKENGGAFASAAVSKR
jgi:hypothetical protein